MPGNLLSLLLQQLPDCRLLDPWHQLVDLISFNIFRFNGSGGTQAPDAFPTRNVFVSAEYTLNGGADWTAIGSTQTVNLSDSVADTPNIPLNFVLTSPVDVDFSTDDFRIRYTVVNDGTNTGAFNGISSIVFNGSVIPEPSAALLGALVLLRRR